MVLDPTRSADRPLRRARLATSARSRLGPVDRGAGAIRNGCIANAGTEADLPVDWQDAAAIPDCDGRWVTPSLIDCHTHPIRSGNRSWHYARLAQGATTVDACKALRVGPSGILH